MKHDVAVLIVGILIVIGITWQLAKFAQISERAESSGNEIAAEVIQAYWPYFLIGAIIVFGLNAYTIFGFIDKYNTNVSSDSYIPYLFKTILFFIIFIVKGIFSILICFCILAYEVYMYVEHEQLEMIPIMKSILELVFPNVGEYGANLYTIAFLALSVLWGGLENSINPPV